MKNKKTYSEEEIAAILQKAKPRPTDDVELRLQKLENSLEIIFLAINQLKSGLDKVYSMASQTEALTGVKAEKFRKVPEKKAISMIKKYISKNPGCRTSEIIFNLHLDPDFVLRILRELKKEGRIRGEEIDRKP